MILISKIKYLIFKSNFVEVEKLLVDDESSGNSSSPMPKKSIAKVNSICSQDYRLCKVLKG